MLKNKTLNDVVWIISLLVISRLVPHWPNVTALGATVLVAPRWFKTNKLILVAPLLAMLISDAVLGFHETMIYTYASVFLVSWVSFHAKEQELKPAQWLGWGLFSSLSFFVITNGGVWLTSGLYEKTINGLINCYVLAVPFLGYEMLGTSVYLVLALVVRAFWVQTPSIARTAKN